MSTARSVFTEAIEEHLALKKQNAALEHTMPLARYDVGDPLDRFPGGPGRAADPNTVIVTDGAEVVSEPVGASMDPDATQMFVGPSPEQAMEAATALEPAFAGQHPFEPLNGMAPMLSLVEDIEDEDAVEPAQQVAVDEPVAADVLRFPGGVGPREDAPQQLDGFDAAGPATSTLAPPQVTETASEFDAPTGEQPILVIDTSEPLGAPEQEPAQPSRRQRTRPRFFGLGRKKAEQPASDTWFTDGPRDFNWD